MGVRQGNAPPRPVEEWDDAEVERIFTEMHVATVNNKKFDSTISGTSATLVSVCEGVLSVACVGNCTSVLSQRGKQKGEDSVRYQTKVLVQPHDFMQKKDRQRVVDAGGDVRCMKGETRLRAFHSGKTYPGIALSRTIGDNLAHEIDISSAPEVTRTTWSDPRAFLIVASDGLWEHVNPDKAVEIVSEVIKSDGPQAAADALANVADEYGRPDDLTVIVVRLSAFKGASQSKNPPAQS